MIAVFTKHAWFKTLNDKNTKTIHNGFTEIVNKSKGKPNNIWVDQGTEFYNNLMQKLLHDNYIWMYCTCNEGKPIVAERFIRTLKAKIYNEMTGSDNKFDLGYFNKLVHEHNNSYHRSIGKKLIDDYYSVLIGKIESSHKAPKFRVGDKVKITSYKNIFSKGYIKNWSRKILIIDSVLKTNPWMYKIKDLNRENIIGSFCEK